MENNKLINQLTPNTVYQRPILTKVKIFKAIFICHYYCRNPNFGLATKAKGVARRWAKRKLGSHVTYFRECRKCEGVNPHTPKATPTLGDGVPVDFQNFKKQFEESKLNGLWRSLYHWKDLGS